MAQAMALCQVLAAEGGYMPTEEVVALTRLRVNPWLSRDMSYRPMVG